MKLELYDKVMLKNGRTANIVEIYEQGVTYEADIEQGDGEFETDTITHGDILYVFADDAGRS